KSPRLAGRPSHCRGPLEWFLVLFAVLGNATAVQRAVGIWRAKDGIRHSVSVRWRNTMLPIADPEHTIVMKLVYGSEQDVEDALGIYVRQGNRLGLRRMRQFASRQGVLADLRDLERRAVEIKDGARGTLERGIAPA